MTRRELPADRPPNIVFAHAAYQLQRRFEPRETGLPSVEVRSLDALEAHVSEADVLVVSGLWRNAMLERAPRLAFVQSISAGTDQYDRDRFAAAGVRLASAQGANERAVAQHAMALLLALARRLPEARDLQQARVWRGMIGAIEQREAELTGRTLVIVGLGRIGRRLARLAAAFEMRVIGVRRHPGAPESDPTGVAGGNDGIAQIVGPDRLHAVLSEADAVALTCPLTPETENLIDAAALAALPAHAWLVNVARGRVVDATALEAALRAGRLAAAALDCTPEEPLPPGSSLWSAPNLLITPHTAGETQRYEDRVLDLLLENLARLRRGETALVNGVV